MAELPVYATDTAICRLLAAGPMPTAAIAARLAMPERTARHRLRQLRRSGIVVTGTDGIHRLAGALPALDAPSAGLAATGDGLAATPATGSPVEIGPGGKGIDGVNREPTTPPGGQWTVLAMLAVASIGLAAVAMRRRPPNPPPPPVVEPGERGQWTGW